MTDGSSQGLFVVVAVVIFGIFVSISYLLFRDNLTPSLASIFGDTLLKVSDESVNLSEGSTKLTKDFFSFDHSTKDLTPESEEFTLEATNNQETGSWLGLTPKGIIMNRGNLYVPYGKRLTYYVDVYSELDITFSIDFNAKVIDDTYINNYDNYGKNSGSNSHQAIKIKAGEWSRISFWYENNHARNINKVDIEDFTRFGFSSTDGNRLKEENKLFKMKNISYKIE